MQENQSNPNPDVADLLRRSRELRELVARLDHKDAETFRQLSQAPAGPAALDLVDDAIDARHHTLLGIQERARAEQALRISEEKYRSLFESIDQGFCIIEVLFNEQHQPVDYRFLEVNPAFEKHTGLKHATGRSILELAPTHEKHWFEVYGRVVLTGEPARFELPATALARVYDVYAFRVGAPEQHRVAVLFNDITARKRHESHLAFLADLSATLLTLRNSAETALAVGERIRTLLGPSLCAFIEIDPDAGTAIVVDEWHEPSAQSLAGTYHLKDFVADRFREMMAQGRTAVIHDVLTDDRIRDPASFAALRIRSFVNVPYLRNGIWCHTLGIYREVAYEWPPDEVALLVEAAARIWTRLEHLRAEEHLAAAEEHLRLLVESALEHAIITMDMDRTVTSWNTGAEKIHGYTRAEILGQTADLIFTPEDRAASIPIREQKAALEKGRANDNRWMLRKDGTRFWANGAMLPMRSRPAGQVVGFVKILRDDTETQQAREALERSREELLVALGETEAARAQAETARQAKDHFLAVLSHELRTPLTPVLLAVRALDRQGNLPPMVRDALQMIARNVQIEANFIDDLLDVTRIERGKFELQRQPLDIHEVLRRALEVCAGDIESKKQQQIVTLQATERRVEGDPTRLQQAFWNLLKNASKFTPERGTIRISTSSRPGRIVIQVADSGIGFTPDMAHTIFDPFSQADPSVTQKYGGLGLGLAITKATVEAHSGTLRGESPGPGQGSTFTVELPLPGAAHAPSESSVSLT